MSIIDVSRELREVDTRYTSPRDKILSIPEGSAEEARGSIEAFFKVADAE